MTTTIILACLGSSGLFAFLEFLITRRDCKNTVERKALQLLLLGELKLSGKEYLQDGFISAEELEAFNETYQTYKALEGNGFAEALYKKVSSLPIKEVNE